MRKPMKSARKFGAAQQSRLAVSGIGEQESLRFCGKACFRPGIENKSEILDTVGWVFLQNGKEDKGLVLLQQAALQAPRNTNIRIHLASAFAKTGKKEEAKKELERLLKENGNFLNGPKQRNCLRIMSLM